MTDRRVLLEKTTDQKNKPLVAIAMSGGVDSSVAAYLLKRKGYQLIGITLKLWEYNHSANFSHNLKESTCCSIEQMNDAREVCMLVDSPHYVLDFQQTFRREVIDNFVSEYKKGRTPNPCVICNQKVKWQALWNKVRPLGADFIATGHYAKLKWNQEDERFQIWKAKDESKDQSYALWRLGQEDLSHTLFPLGDFTKSEIRGIAHNLGWKIAHKVESQDLCFVGDTKYADFIVKNQNGDDDVQPGPILDLEGNQIGTHKGLAFYTIGQRKGLDIAVGKPLYVVKLDPQENALYVSDNKNLLGKRFSVKNVNWVSIACPQKEISADIKIRYNHKGVSGKLIPSESGEIEVSLDILERAITPGQSAVFYQGELLLGGGIIEEVKEFV